MNNDARIARLRFRLTVAQARARLRSVLGDLEDLDRAALSNMQRGIWMDEVHQPAVLARRRMVAIWRFQEALARARTTREMDLLEARDPVTHARYFRRARG